MNIGSNKNPMIVSVLAVLILALALTGCAPLGNVASPAKTVTTQDALDLVVQRGTLIVSTELGNYPWAYKDPKTGVITGLVIDIARGYATALGVKLQVNTYVWAGLIPALTTGKVDMVAAPLSRTIARSVKILYCDPYVTDPGVVYALKGKYTSLSDLNKKGVILTTTAGSIHETMAKTLFPNATMNALGTVSDTTAAVLSGRANASLTSRSVGLGILKTNPKLEILPGSTFMDSLACAVNFSSFKLWKSFNMYQQMIKLDGTYGKLFKQYFGVNWVASNVQDGL